MNDANCKINDTVEFWTIKSVRQTDAITYAMYQKLFMPDDNDVLSGSCWDYAINLSASMITVRLMVLGGQWTWPMRSLNIMAGIYMCVDIKTIDVIMCCHTLNT